MLCGITAHCVKTQYAVLPHNIEIAEYCNVTSPYVYISSSVDQQ